MEWLEEIREFLRELWRDGDFYLPISFTMLAYFTFGVTGALAGLRRGYDLIGVLILAIISAGGGGLIRDSMLISSGPASMLTDSRYLVVVVVAVLAAWLFHRYVERVRRTIAVIDALGLGAFAVHGVQRSLDAGLSIPAAILGGTITAVGGGLMRDIVVRDEPLLFKPGQFYALVAVGGSCLFVGLVEWDWTTENRAALVTIVAVFAVRMLAIRFNWRTTAMYRVPLEPSEPPEPSEPAEPTEPPA